MKCLIENLEVNYPCSTACALYGDCMTAFLEAKKQRVRTNADCIRAMSDEDIFRLLNKVYCAGTHDANSRDGFTWGLEWLRNCAKIENLPEGEKPASITDLLARAEAADGRCKEEKHNTEYWEKTAKNWESNWNSELELRKAAEARAEQAERERDAAVEDLRQMCVGGNTCAFCKYGRGCGKQGPGRKTVEPCWEWRGQKEE